MYRHPSRLSIPPQLGMVGGSPKPRKLREASAIITPPTVLLAHGVRISMDSVGGYMGNVFVERLWRSVKYEEVYLKAYESVAEARAGIGAYLSFYNNERPHQALDYRTPAQVFEEGRNQVHRPEVSLTSKLVPA
jgi:transposase InsO family protein